ncbi:MAG: 4Fe-4S cluster-binding domain-containing protein [Candidatus Bathyarchaeia archaeon]
MFIKAVKDNSLCRDCGFCSTINKCLNIKCVGCLSCYFACPHEAKKIIVDEAPRGTISIVVNGIQYSVPEGITIKEALKRCGYEVGIYPSEGKIQAPCSSGGCWTCAVISDGELVRPCITGVKDHMEINTNASRATPLRIIHGPEPHAVGGKATPWFEGKGIRYIEVAIWAAGCNLRCRSCQNYSITYDNSSTPMSPGETAREVTRYRRIYGVNGMAISGGEPTLNKRWLIEYF